MISLITLPFRLAFGSVRVGYRAGRLVGPGRAVFFGLGFGLGVLAVSPKAREAALKGVAKASEAIADARTPDPVPDMAVNGPVDGPVIVSE